MICSAPASQARPRYVWPTLVAIILLAAAVRLIALKQSPPGLAPDEATNGYDAYSLLLTGRDQHGHLLPLVMQSFNDYRMPLFIYSAIPFIGLFGLTPASIRLAAAFWGILTVPVAYWLGARMAGHRAGCIAALLLALSAWHIPLSRMGFEFTLVNFVVTLAVALLWQWHTDHRERWLVLSGAMLGLSLYTYSIAKLVVPMLLLLVAALWGRDFLKQWKASLIAGGLMVLLALPMIYLTLHYPEQMQGRYDQIAIFRPGRAWPEAASEFLRLFAAHLSPNYLFVRGDADALQHPPFGGQLYWIQLPLLVIGLLSLCQARHRPAILFNVAWIFLAAVPAALTQPNMPGSPHSTRNIIAVVPLQLLSALGANELWKLKQLRPSLRAGLIGLLGIGLALNAGWFLNRYFTVYPAKVAGRFEDGMQQVIQTMQTLESSYPAVTFSDRVAWPYIYVLFFTRYDPQALLADPPVRGDEMFAPVTRMGKYRVTSDIEQAYRASERGLFIGPAGMLPDVPALAIIRRPANGTPFCKMVGK